MPILKIRDFATVIQYADLEDIPNEAATVMKNFRIVHGKIIKTSEMGIKLDDDLIHDQDPDRVLTGIFTWINTHLSTTGKPPSSGAGLGYLAALVNDDPTLGNLYKHLELWLWKASTSVWSLIGGVAKGAQGNSNPDVGIDLVTAPYHQAGNSIQKYSQSPIFYCNDILRILPGYTAKPNDEDVASGLWIGWIGRNYFDGFYLASAYTAKFFSFPTKISKPELTVTQKQIYGGDYNPIAVKAIITDTSSVNSTISVGGDISEHLRQSAFVKITENETNKGAYLISNFSYDTANQITVIKYDANFFVLSDDTKDYGFVEVPGGGQTMYYRFSYLYDGDQESLMGEPISVEMDLATGLFPRFSFSITKTTHNMRITGINMYRSASANGPWRLIQTIDLTRPSTDVMGQANTGGRTGITAAYIPDLASIEWGEGDHTLYIKSGSGTWKTMTFTSGTALATGVICSKAQGDDFAGEDMWNVAWQVKLGATMLYSGSNGAYAGENCLVVGLDTGEHDAAGGILYLRHGSESQIASSKMAIASAATHSSGNRTQFTIDTSIMAAHGFEVGETVELYGFSEEQYNGTFVVVKVTSTTAFVCDVKYSSTDTGYWINIGKERLVDDNYKYALHLANAIRSSVSASEGWTLMKPQKGLFYAINGTDVTYRVYDPSLPDGEEHPLAGEVSVDVHGAYAEMVGGRLFQGKIILDPSDKAEERPSWGSYSELNQPDVNPVSNILPFLDSDGGEITGVMNLWDNPVFLREKSIRSINIKTHPTNPKLWDKVDSAHDIGNLAPQGAVRAGDVLYVCAHDGIYGLRPNNLAPSDGTPTEKLKITEVINNIYNAMTPSQKANIRGVYHQRRNEINYWFTYTQDEVDYPVQWAYNIITGAWREVDNTRDITCLAVDENNNAMVYDANIEKVCEIESEAADSRCTYRSKMLPIGDVRQEPVHYITIIYKSPHALKLAIYVDGNDTAAVEYDLPAQARMLPYRVKVGYRAYRLQFVITDDTGEELIVEEEAGDPVYLIVEQNNLSPNVEIGGMDIDYA